MKKTFLIKLSIGAIALLLPIFAFAQTDRTVLNASQIYVISAKAGGVNFIEGKVAIVRKEGKSGYLLKSDTIEVGDKISTGADGKAEILLNPGSYIRLAANSEFEFLTTSLDDLRLKLTRGSAMLEVFADKDYAVSVTTPNAQFTAVKSGVYRVDVLSDGSSNLEVWEGRAQIGTTEVKEGRAATVINGQTAITKFDRDEKDTLETWSKNRAKELTKINARLERRNLRNTLVSGFQSNSWNMYNSFGLWVSNPMYPGHCFLPFGNGWSSPYGYYYGWNIWNIRLPYFIYNQPQVPVITNPGGNNTANNTDRQTTRENPPFQNIQKDVGRSPVDSSNPQTDRSSFPTYQPSAPIIVAPSNTGAKTRDN